MGVAYHAHARFLDGNGNKITVPAPVDPSTPRAAWWYDYIATQASSLKRAGFTAILYPPVCKTQSGHLPTGDGYGVFDQYDLGSKPQCGSTETRFGTREQLQRSIAIARACGLDVYVDVVMHQLNGGANGVYEYVGADGKTKNGRFAKHSGCFRGDPPRRPEDPVPVPKFDFAFGDEFVYVNCEPPGYTTNGMVAFGDWLTRSLDIQGYRVDDTKGTAVSFVHHWMTSRSMANRFCVSEYFDGDPDNLNWWVHQSGMGGRSAVFDFTLHFVLQAMCDDPGFDMTRINGAGYAAKDPFNAATFVDNPDTDLSPGEPIIGNKLLAYAFILTTEGYPFVYHKDYSEDPGCYGLKEWIDNLVWIHETLANGPTTTRFNDLKTIVLERLGAPGLLTAISTDTWNARNVTCQTAFGANTQLHEYTGKHGDVRTDGDGRVTFTIPSNAFGRGQSYLCFSRAGQDRALALEKRVTQQTFFGAADLDIPPIPVSGTARAGRLWCAAHEPLRATLHAPTAPPGVQLLLEVIGPTGSLLASRVFTGSSGLLTATTAAKGFHELRVGAEGLTGPVPYELDVSYTAPQEFDVQKEGKP
jgi:alpha-amylase